ncbi:S8 family serine peptidase [Micromonospora sp. NPDC050200]|uniref:S8 family serine peptidase n=1 Tax=Micromonospora sp. NPDC050200 TaxID=3155664 RepID=UPI0033E7D9FB
MLVTAMGGPAAAAPSPTPTGLGSNVRQSPGLMFVKYYVVGTDSDGRPELLWHIAARLLGDGERYRELLDLNQGRSQPDGGRLSSPNLVRSGWVLLLPWDATGDGVRYGVPPVAALSRPGTAARTPSPPPIDRTQERCGARSSWAGPDLSWAQLRLAPDSAWARSRGRGVSVAVLDSGVDASAPALSGRVLAGFDVTGNGRRGDQDCQGHGTALAAIIAARPSSGRGLVGIAPEANILPIRLNTRGGTANPAEIVEGLRRASADGAKVVVIGVPADLTDARIQDAVRLATLHDAVVVTPAPPSGSPGAKSPVGVLQVGAAGADDQPVGEHPPGSVDVLAPGVRVLSLGLGGKGFVEGTGADFAVPFVAGLVAVLRASEPGLSAPAAANRIMRTAGRRDDGPDLRQGWGLIDPGAALGVDSRSETGRQQGQLQNGSGSSHAPVLVAALCTLALLLRIGRRSRRPPVWLRTMLSTPR